MLRLLSVVALLPYCAWLIGAYRFHFPDHVNLAVHEAGHLLFRPLGMVAHMAGGTLLQLLAPLAFVASFLCRGRRFDAAVCGLWFAESLMYTATYLGDAYLMALPRVGGELHDWNWLLSRWGLVHEAPAIGLGVHALAGVLAAGCVLAAGAVALREHQASRVAHAEAHEVLDG